LLSVPLQSMNALMLICTQSEKDTQKKGTRNLKSFFSDFSMSGPKNLVIIIWILRGERLGVICWV